MIQDNLLVPYADWTAQHAFWGTDLGVQRSVASLMAGWPAVHLVGICGLLGFRKKVRGCVSSLIS